MLAIQGIIPVSSLQSIIPAIAVRSPSQPAGIPSLLNFARGANGLPAATVDRVNQTLEAVYKVRFPEDAALGGLQKILQDKAAAAGAVRGLGGTGRRAGPNRPNVRRPGGRRHRAFLLGVRAWRQRGRGR